MMPAEATETAIETLARARGCDWPAIKACAEASLAERKRLGDLVRDEKLIPADCSFVTFGSLARDEFTKGSDIDWALLIDGAANPQHLDIVKRIAEALDAKPPGPTNVFGCPVFSHDLVHLIGGQSDTNSNTTRRILLLLESRALAEQAPVRERVMRHLFRRYVEEDRGYHALHEYSVRVPRFLLNDIVRFWRTMAVNYAHKRRERDSEGWAIRNVKLRISRKLIFVAGLAMCMNCQLSPSEGISAADEREFAGALEAFLLGLANRTPLEAVASLANDFKGQQAGVRILTSYDEFLAMLSDQGKRQQLEKLDVESAQADNVFQEARVIGNEFQAGLTQLFFDTDPDLTKAIQRYGVF